MKIKLATKQEELEYLFWCDLEDFVKAEEREEAANGVEFNMTINEAISHIKSKTSLIRFLHNYDMFPGDSSFQVRTSLNNRQFILETGGLFEKPFQRMNLFISVEGWSIQQIVEAFNLAISSPCEERGILDKDQIDWRLPKYKRKK